MLSAGAGTLRNMVTRVFGGPIQTGGVLMNPTRHMQLWGIRLYPLKSCKISTVGEDETWTLAVPAFVVCVHVPAPEPQKSAPATLCHVMSGEHWVSGRRRRHEFRRKPTWPNTARRRLDTTKCFALAQHCSTSKLLWTMAIESRSVKVLQRSLRNQRLQG